MATTWQDVNLSWWTLANRVTWPFDHVILRDHVIIWNYYSSTTTVSLVTKLGKLVPCHKGLLSIMLLHALATWSCEIMWETKTIMPLLPQYLCTKTWQHSDLPWLPFTHKVEWPYNYVVLWYHVRQFKKISPLKKCLWPQNLARWWLTLIGFYT